MAYNFKKRCEESDKSFRSKDLKFAKYNSQVNSEELVKPETTNSKDSLKCKFCDKSFSYERSLHLHERKHETGLKCYICSKLYSIYCYASILKPTPFSKRIQYHASVGQSY